jgi:hypothetical protein
MRTAWLPLALRFVAIWLLNLASVRSPAKHASSAAYGSP